MVFRTSFSQVFSISYRFASRYLRNNIDRQYTGNVSYGFRLFIHATKHYLLNILETNVLSGPVCCIIEDCFMYFTHIQYHGMEWTILIDLFSYNVL